VIEVNEIHEAGELRPERLAVRVRGLERLNHDVMRLQLQLPRDRRMQFMAGQYIEVITREGRHRAYSLANPPHDDGALELHVRFVSGGDFTEHVFGGMREGEVLQIQGPLGQFTLREASPNPVVLVAGGTGFAPIKGRGLGRGPAELQLHPGALGAARRGRLGWPHRLRPRCRRSRLSGRFRRRRLRCGPAGDGARGARRRGRPRPAGGALPQRPVRVGDPRGEVAGR
jgi:hypothetical protein